MDSVVDQRKTPRRQRGRNAIAELCQRLQANRSGAGLGVYSVCSANRFVLEAAMVQAARDDSLLLIESTSNQVNQFGGYTGQTPTDFARLVHGIAQEMHFPVARIVLGGDHLGPQVWRKMTAVSAMEKACEMVAEYVRAGFTKIHLDASMPCADDVTDQSKPLADEVVCARAAQLCEAAEQAFHSLPRNATPPVYVIGTEVPAPGGENSGSARPKVTRTKDLANTLDVAKESFVTRGLNAAWERVIAIVVQPGVEFGDASVWAYDSQKAQPLARFITKHWLGIYEAHSTDYQQPQALRDMVKDHFALLKVGPALTFAFREAVFALEAVEREWLSAKNGLERSCVREALEKTMLENPFYWKNYYRGDEDALRLARKYSYSDRARYYWPQPAVAAAVERLIDNLTARPAPVALLSQYMPRQANEVRAGRLTNEPRRLIRHRILEVVDQYAFACGFCS
jgi:D-tagatose-1,6-bisphosphate aldolase subunit GatZ/KbaZ